MKSRQLIRAAGAVLIAAAASCKNDSLDPEGGPVASVIITPSTATVAVGATLPLTAEVLDVMADLQETIEADNLVLSMAHNMAVPQKYRAAMFEVITEFVNDASFSPEDAAVELSDAVANEL